MYVNGKPVGRATVPASYQPGPKNVGIGCNLNYPGPEVFQGALAEVLLVREAWPDDEIKKLAGALVTDDSPPKQIRNPRLECLKHTGEHLLPRRQDRLVMF